MYLYANNSNQSYLLGFYGENGHDCFQLTYDSETLVHDSVLVLMRQKKLAYLHIIPTYQPISFLFAFVLCSNFPTKFN